MITAKKTPPRKNTAPTRKYATWTVLCFLLIACVVAALELTNTTYWFHDKPKPAAATGPGTVDKGTPTSEDPTGTSDGTKDGDEQVPTPTPGVPPKAPSGNFISSHSLPMDGTAQSVCNTTPGAKCTITFTMNGTAKSLPEKPTDNSGSVFWTWTPEEIGLSVGEWKITAVASIDNERTSAEDAITLKVSP